MRFLLLFPNLCNDVDVIDEIGMFRLSRWVMFIVVIGVGVGCSYKKKLKLIL